MSPEDDEDNDPPPKSCPTIPQRYIVTLMVFLNFVLAFSSRNVLLVADDYYINIISLHSSYNVTQRCPELVPKQEENNYEKFKKLVTMDVKDVGKNYVYFHLGYPLGNLIGGIYANMYGGKHIVALSVFLASVITVNIPWYLQAVNVSHLGIKFLSTSFGMSQGLLLPPCMHILAHWIPIRQQTLLTVLAFSGLYFGHMINSMSTPWMINSSLNWRTPFYVYGAIGFAMTLLWELLVYSTPHQNPRIQPSELLYLDIEMEGLIDHRPKTIPYKKILSSVPVWAFVVASLGSSWAWNLVSFLHPVYSTVVLKYNKSEFRLMSNIPNFAVILTLALMGFFSDWILHHGYINRLTIRKVFTTMGMMGPPIYMLTASYAGCNRVAAQVMFLICNALTGFVPLGSFLLPFDMAPNYCGFLMALGNGFGMITGFFRDLLEQAIVPNQTIREYRRLSWLALIIAFVTNSIFIVFGDTHLQTWNKVPTR